MENLLLLAVFVLFYYIFTSTALFGISSYCLCVCVFQKIFHTCCVSKANWGEVAIFPQPHIGHVARQWLQFRLN